MVRAQSWFRGPLALLLLAALFLAALFFVGLGCRQAVSWPVVKKKIRKTFPAVRQLSTRELAAWMDDSGRPTILIDARQPEEFAVSHLPGALWIDPEARGEALLAALPEDLPKDAKIVAYCSVGYRSSAVVERLMAAGFEEVYNLEGSIFQWANEGREVMREGRGVREVHPFDPTWGRLLSPELQSYGEQGREP